MATNSSILAWKIPWTEEPGGLYSIHMVAKSWTQLMFLSTHIQSTIMSFFFTGGKAE